MSLSNPKTSSNPAKKFIEWGGKEGVFKYYDKSSETNVILPLPLYIIPLDQLTTITGYDDVKKMGIYSNEVHYTNQEELHVRYQDGKTVCKGLYGDISGDIAKAKGKFCRSVYAAMISSDGGEMELVNFKLYGSALGPFDRDWETVLPS